MRIVQILSPVDYHLTSILLMTRFNTQYVPRVLFGHLPHRFGGNQTFEGYHPVLGGDRVFCWRSQRDLFPTRNVHRID